MNERLDIPLSIDPTRQLMWRVVRVSAVVALLLIGGWVLFRSMTTFDRTFATGPSGTTSAIRILKTPKAERIVDEHLSRIQLLPGSPWSLSDILRDTQRGVNIFWHNNDVTLVLDYEIDDETLLIAEAYNYSTRVDAGATVISTATEAPTLNTTLPRVTLSTLRPSTVGLLSTNGSTAAIRAEKESILIPSQLLTPSDIQTTVDPSARSLMSLSVGEQLTETLTATTLPENTPGSQFLARMLSGKGTNIELYELESELLYRISALRTQTGNLAAEDLAAIGREIVGIPHLTLDELTLPDGTTVDELKAPDIEETIHDEHPYTFVTVASEGKTVRLSLSPELVTLTNASVLPTEENETPRSDCLHSAHAWIKPEAMNAYFPQPTRFHSLTGLSLLLEVGEIASSRNKTRICW